MKPLYTVEEIDRWAAEKGISYGMYVALGLAEKEHPRQQKQPKKKPPKYRLTDICSGENILCFNLQEIAELSFLCKDTVSTYIRAGRLVGNFKVEKLDETEGKT